MTFLRYDYTEQARMLTAADLERHEAERLPVPAEAATDVGADQDSRPWDSYDYACLATLILCIFGGLVSLMF